jgi:hypothetical protein
VISVVFHKVWGQGEMSRRKPNIIKI